MNKHQNLLLILCLLAFLVSPTLGEQDLSKLSLSKATLYFGVGPERMALQTDGTGAVSFQMGDESEDVGKVTGNGEFISSEGETIMSLDAEGFLVADGERTTIRIDEAAILEFESKPVLKIEAGKILKLEASEEFAQQLKDIEVAAEPGSDRLVAFLLCLYLLVV